MTSYSMALALHLVSVLAAAAASGMTLQSALRLRAARDLAELQSALSEIRRAVRVFPLATLGLVATGGYMTHTTWGWTSPWVIASISGLALISFIGSKVEGGRLKSLGTEVHHNGLTQKARRMTRDPVTWIAKSATVTLLVAVVVEMCLKPAALPAAAGLLLALATAIPLGLWFARGGSSPAASLRDPAIPSGLEG